MQRSVTRAADVKRALEGDQETFSHLVLECQGTLYAASMAILRNEEDALDAVQDAILLAWRKLDTLREHRYFNTWLTRIVIRTAINLRKRRKPTTELREVPARDMQQEEIMDVRQAMDSLDERARLCATLYYYEGFSIDEVAQAIGMRAGAVKSMLYRARQRLRKVLEVSYYDE